MYKWKKYIQIIVDEIDQCIQNDLNDELTLHQPSQKLGYSQFYMTRKFKEIAGMSLRDYLHHRKLAFALKDVRNSSHQSLLEIACYYGFSSHEAFTRSFKNVYGITPSEYRKNPQPVILRTKINAFDRYCLGLDEIGMIQSSNDINVYYITIPAHKFPHIRNFQSNGYWNFWQKQNLIQGQDYETINEANCGSGQIMAYINDPHGRLCDWGIPRIECWGVRLPYDYDGDIPNQMILMDIPEAEYIVFEHGPFDYEQENCSVEERIEKAMSDFDFHNTDYCLDMSYGRIMYFYYNPEQYFKYIRPISKKCKPL